MTAALSLGTLPAREENSYGDQLKMITTHKEKEPLNVAFFLPHLGHLRSPGLPGRVVS